MLKRQSKCNQRFNKTLKQLLSRGNPHGINSSHLSMLLLINSGSINPRYKIDNKRGERHYLKVIQKGALSHYQLIWWEQGEYLQQQMDLVIKQNGKYLIGPLKVYLVLTEERLLHTLAIAPSYNQQYNPKV
jgi:hypothetical protein